MLITLEGIEGSGKTTQLGHMVDYFKTKGKDCVVTREPGDTEIGRKIRAILLDPENKNLDPMAELFLYAADRAQHIEERIKPSILSGKIVISDRFHDATTVYQGCARGLHPDIINRIHRIVLKDLKPDVTLLFDLPPEIGLKRAWQQVNAGTRTNTETRFEKEALSFHEKVRQGYLDLARHEPERFYVIDASLPEEKVTAAIINILNGMTWVRHKSGGARIEIKKKITDD
ncbi:MAG: dTMP kinase [Proteobacteria bacterium]|nr:dTMP kinase [Pseudomonadota bacterium]